MTVRDLAVKLSVFDGDNRVVVLLRDKTNPRAFDIDGVAFANDTNTVIIVVNNDRQVST